MARKKYRRIDNSSNKYYTNTSEAYDFDVAPPRENIVPKRKKKKIKTIKKVRQKTEYKYELNKSLRFSPVTYVTILVLFCGSIGVLFFTSQISFKNLKIESMHNELTELKNENAFLKDEITNYDLNKIEEIATNKLGMRKPQQHQIIKINVPVESYTIKYDIEEDLQKESFFDKLGDMFVKD